MGNPLIVREACPDATKRIVGRAILFSKASRDATDGVPIGLPRRQARSGCYQAIEISVRSAWFHDSAAAGRRGTLLQDGLADFASLQKMF
jgi:hypothetical protein